ncbi:TPA: hypothetical protein VGT17_005226 [Vibrio harveyi]|nr:hypothetical protein [Vibrio harveyi]HEQ3599258.1 hypothetical protein [Vibrio harveyi]HEQ3611316.1 hypothetical protein [Vibrio harveyi]
MPRNNIPDTEIWAWDGELEKPDSNRFQKGNESGQTAKPPKHTEFNWESKRADENMQYILRNATMPWDKDEKYPVGARVTLASKEYECIKESTNNNPTTSPDNWKLAPVEVESIVGGEKLVNTDKPQVIESQKTFKYDGQAIIVEPVSDNQASYIRFKAADGTLLGYIGKGGADNTLSFAGLGGQVNLTEAGASLIGMKGNLTLSADSAHDIVMSSRDILLNPESMVKASGALQVNSGQEIATMIGNGSSATSGRYIEIIPVKDGTPYWGSALRHYQDANKWSFQRTNVSIANLQVENVNIGNNPEDLVTTNTVQDITEDKRFYLDGQALSLQPATEGQACYLRFKAADGTNLGYLGKGDASNTVSLNVNGHQINLASGGGALSFVAGSGGLALTNQGATDMVLTSGRDVKLKADRDIHFDGASSINYGGVHANYTSGTGTYLSQGGVLGVSRGRYLEIVPRVDGTLRWSSSLRYYEAENAWDFQSTNVKIKGINEHAGKTAVGVSVQANDVAGESYQEFYDYGGDFFDLVSFDPSTYETHIYESGYYLVDVIVMRGEVVSTAVSGINVALKVNEVQYSDGFVAKEDATKRNPISLKVVLKLNAGDKVRVYSGQDAEWQAGGSITFQYLRP